MRQVLVVFVVVGCGGDGLDAMCSNGMKDGDETDIDCGGSCPMACGTGQGCRMAKDCQSMFCTNGTCDAPSCMDGVKNGKETDVDCGGSACPPCTAGKMCTGPADCDSLTCTNGVCVASQCMNGKKDGMETDVDCGGGTCLPCAAGKMCLMGSDCVSGQCTNNVCVGGDQPDLGVQMDMASVPDMAAPKCAPAGFIQNLPTTLDFGTQVVHSGGNKQANFTNNSGGNIMVSKASITNANNQPAFSLLGYQGNPPPTTLPPGSTLGVIVTFSAPAVGNYSGDIVVETDKGTATVCLKGAAQ